VVPHRGTNWAALWLTAQIGRDAVLSESYGRGYLFHERSLFISLIFRLYKRFKSFRIRIRDSDYNRISTATTDYSYERQLERIMERKAWGPVCRQNVERGDTVTRSIYMMLEMNTGGERELCA
jgi:hypothetical protein